VNERFDCFLLAQVVLLPSQLNDRNSSSSSESDAVVWDGGTCGSRGGVVS